MAEIKASRNILPLTNVVPLIRGVRNSLVGRLRGAGGSSSELIMHCSTGQYVQLPATSDVMVAGARMSRHPPLHFFA